MRILGRAALSKVLGKYYYTIPTFKAQALCEAQRAVTAWEDEEWLAHQSEKAGGDFYHALIMELCKRMRKRLELKGIPRPEEET